MNNLSFLYQHFQKFKLTTIKQRLKNPQNIKSKGYFFLLWQY